MPLKHSLNYHRPFRRFRRLAKDTGPCGQLPAQFAAHILFQLSEQAKKQLLQIGLSSHPFEQLDSSSIRHFRITDHYFRKWITFSLREPSFPTEITFRFMRIEY